MVWRPLVDRFWAMVDKQPGDACWLWRGYINKSGYAIISVEGRSQLAHRVSANMHGKPAEHWQIVGHTCSARHCVRPEHLTVGTRAQIWKAPDATVLVSLLDKDGRKRKVALPKKEAEAILRRRHKQKAALQGRKKCVVCGFKMVKAHLKRRQATCSEACWLEAYHRKRPLTLAKKNIVCARRGCENKVPYRKQRKPPKYCGTQCRALLIGRHLKKHRRRRSRNKMATWQIQSCVVCRDWFAATRHKGAITCGQVCKTKLINYTRHYGTPRRPPPRKPRIVKALCVMCGATFVQTPHPKLTCGELCARALRKDTIAAKRTDKLSAS